jgi:heme/copper-type cytochrome/quinol oxidase subunit 2
MCLDRSCTPVTQIWLDFITASILAWLKATSSSAVFMAFSTPSFIFAWVASKLAVALAKPSFKGDATVSTAMVATGSAAEVISTIFDLLVVIALSHFTFVTLRADQSLGGESV